MAKETHKCEINEALSAILPAQLKVSHCMALYLDWNDRNIAFNLHKETQNNHRFGWVTMVSVPSCSKRSPTRFGDHRFQMALIEKARHFLHRWYFPDREVAHRLRCLWYLLTSLWSFLLLKSSAVEEKCYLATNSSGKLACKDPVFCFSIIAWTVRSCWSAVPIFLVVYAGDYMHLATVFLTWTLS